MVETFNFIFKKAGAHSKKQLGTNNELQQKYNDRLNFLTNKYRENLYGTGKLKTNFDEKITGIFHDFVSFYLLQDASPDELVQKLKPFENVIQVEITNYRNLGENIAFEDKIHVNFSHQSPLEVLNKLFQSFYTDTTMFSRSKTALKLALEKHNVTYETAADWYGLIGWDMPVVTDENNIFT